MKQITEDYVSFEVAVLLKEKGFDEITQGYINTDQEVYMCPFQQGVYELGKKQYPYPTHQMALKWLREVHNIHISFNVGCDVDNKNYIFYTPTIVKFNNESIEYIEPFGEEDDEFDSNEQAVEAALKYTLENLIGILQRNLTMKREDIFGSDVQWIENWVQRVESLTGLQCHVVRQVWNKPSFTKKELEAAQREEARVFKGLANDLLRLC